MVDPQSNPVNQEPTEITISPAGAAFTAVDECHCYGGWHYVGYEEDGEEQVVAVPCQRCNAQQPRLF